MEYDLVSKWDQKRCHGMRTQLSLPARRCQSAHGSRATVQLYVSNILKEIGLFLSVSEMSRHVRKFGMGRVALDERGQDGD